MREDEARRFLLVRAVERHDAAGALLTAEDRQQATAAGLDAADDDRGRARGDEGFLVRRSAFAFGRIATRSPGVAQAVEAARWPAWIGWAVPLAALLLGVATDQLAGGRRLNIIALPLVATLGWNLVVYAGLVAGGVLRVACGPTVRPLGDRLERALLWAAARMRRPDRRPAAVTGALTQFAADWAAASAGLTRARTGRTLHLAAATFAAGVLLGLVWRSVFTRYEAGWESTWLDGAALAPLLGVLLGPASWLTGIGLPDAARLDALAWAPGRPGGDARPWIQLIAVTTALYVIGPRLLLAAWQAARAWRLERRFAVAGAEDGYVRRLLREARGGEAVVRVTPYSFRPGTALQQRLTRLLTAVTGDRASVAVDEPVAPGTEEAWLAGLVVDPATDHLLLLFNLSATPEAETHGAFAEGVRTRLGDRAVLTAVVEESAYRARLGAQAGAAQRLAERRAAWTTVLGRAGVAALTIDCEDGDEDGLVRRLEGALVRSPTLT